VVAWIGLAEISPAEDGGLRESSAVAVAKAVAGEAGHWQILRAGALMPLDLLPGA